VSVLAILGLVTVVIFILVTLGLCLNIRRSVRLGLGFGAHCRTGLAGDIRDRAGLDFGLVGGVDLAVGK
jgi:hypothetical protein